MWLKSLFPAHKVEESTLNMLPPKELPRQHTVVVHVKDEEVSAREAIEFLDRQKKSFQSEE